MRRYIRGDSLNPPMLRCIRCDEWQNRKTTKGGEIECEHCGYFDALDSNHNYADIDQ